ncbi:MAG: DUF3047 domain-containing protein [Candidatus Omnitrophica bacterium]|nr:DUF3047 domain-containing protein [Candidatus Omnitrophota bacterium]
MDRKRIVRLSFILLPLLFLFLQILWQPPSQRPQKIQRAFQALVPPLGIILHYFDFNERNALARWEDKMFQGRVAYWIDFDDSGARLPARQGFIHAKSIGATSAIFYRIKFNVTDYPSLSWKWRVGKFPDKSKVLDPKKRDDFAARFYVVFVSRFFTNFHCIEYLWDEFLPEGTILKSPYTDRIKQIVIQSGPASSSEWVQETQNVFEDYKKLFGKPPKMKVAAIALMTNASGTQTEAEGFFDDIKIGKP